MVWNRELLKRLQNTEIISYDFRSVALVTPSSHGQIVASWKEYPVIVALLSGGNGMFDPLDEYLGVFYRVTYRAGDVSRDAFVNLNKGKIILHIQFCSSRFVYLFYIRYQGLFVV